MVYLKVFQSNAIKSSGFCQERVCLFTHRRLQKTLLPPALAEEIMFSVPSICLSGFVRATLCTTSTVQDYMVLKDGIWNSLGLTYSSITTSCMTNFCIRYVNAYALIIVMWRCPSHCTGVVRITIAKRWRLSQSFTRLFGDPRDKGWSKGDQDCWG